MARPKVIDRRRKLTDVDVAAILTRITSTTDTYAAIAAGYGVSTNCILTLAKKASVRRNKQYAPRNCPALTAQELRVALHYDPATGIFEGPHRRTGKIGPIGSVNPTRPIGYVAISIRSRSYLAHRLAWLYVHGEWPAAHLDHINGNPADNRIANLRECTARENLANARLVNTRSSVRRGGCYDQRTRKYRAYVRVNNKHHELGYFVTAEDAVAARVEAEQRLYGEFARRA